MTAIGAGPVVIEHTGTLLTDRICIRSHLVKMLRSRKAPSAK
ncbi:hypothetical protein swp_2149 [Shewanella piezotolerans WP3]|uniref:Uncharacterized protein n=1 Tax=Shewanella piezotolerans (strain WP3 / JCM 13877) TaxID=225849 RepID=B8CLX5_SHEPW|nr:hypothetical protein swp_2149 [Shewanella piezotolerans WP3]